jgi:hypothetical protein
VTWSEEAEELVRMMSKRTNQIQQDLEAIFITRDGRRHDTGIAGGVLVAICAKERSRSLLRWIYAN